MKTLKKVPIELVRVEFIPEDVDMEFGKFYYSEKYTTASHICPCGCGKVFPVPIKENEWSISMDSGKLTVTPSFLHRIQCKSHYVITSGNANLLREGLPESMWYKNHWHDDAQPGE